MLARKRRRHREHVIGLSILWLVLALIAMDGCASPPKATVKADDVVLGRRLYETEQAFIYASSEPAANETGGDLTTAFRNYQKATGHTPVGKGLVIVTDKEDPPYADREKVVWMGHRYDDLQSFQAATTLPADMQQNLAEFERQIGPEAMDRIMLSKPGTADVTEAVKIWSLGDRPARAARWVLAVPTVEMAQYAIHITIEKAMSQKNVSGIGRALAAPLLGLVEAKARQAAEDDRQIAAFLMLTLNDASLDMQARKKVFQKYQQRKGEAIMRDMTTPPATGKPGPASKPSA
jgi:hypothetical protein